LTTRTPLLLLLLLPLTGAACAETPDDPVARASRQQFAIERSQHIAFQAQCETNLEIYAPGTRPTRPYRVLGPVGSWGVTARSRFVKMRKRACELGADAIVGAWERWEETPTTVTTRVGYDGHGQPVTTVEEQDGFARRTQPLAIAFTDTARVVVAQQAPVVISQPAPVVIAQPAPVVAVVCPEDAECGP